MNTTSNIKFLIDDNNLVKRIVLSIAAQRSDEVYTTMSFMSSIFAKANRVSVDEYDDQNTLSIAINNIYLIHDIDNIIEDKLDTIEASLM